MNRQILMLQFSNKQFVEPNYFLIRKEGVDFRNEHSRKQNKETICLVFRGWCTKRMFSSFVVFLIFLKRRSAAKITCFAYKRIHQFRRQVDIYIANNSIRLPH